jgi:hypothetical protein
VSPLSLLGNGFSLSLSPAFFVFFAVRVITKEIRRFVLQGNYFDTYYINVVVAVIPSSFPKYLYVFTVSCNRCRGMCFCSIL